MIIKESWKIFPPGENESEIKNMDGKPWKQCETLIMWSTREKFNTTSENTRKARYTRSRHNSVFFGTSKPKY